MLYASMHNIEGDGTSGQKAAGTSGSGQRAARTKVAAWSYCVRDGADESQELRSSKTYWAPGKSDEHPERVEANLGLLKDHSATPDHEEKRAASGEGSEGTAAVVLPLRAPGTTESAVQAAASREERIILYK